jgi:hypothetical protein
MWGGRRGGKSGGNATLWLLCSLGPLRDRGSWVPAVPFNNSFIPRTRYVGEAAGRFSDS